MLIRSHLARKLSVVPDQLVGGAGSVQSYDKGPRLPVSEISIPIHERLHLELATLDVIFLNASHGQMAAGANEPLRNRPQRY